MSQDLLDQARKILEDNDRGAEEFKKFLQAQSDAGNNDFLTDAALQSLVEGRSDDLKQEVDRHAQNAKEKIDEEKESEKQSEKQSQEEDNKLEQSEKDKIHAQIITGPEGEEYSKELGQAHTGADKKILAVKAIGDKGEEIELKLDEDGVNLDPLTKEKFTGIVKVSRRKEDGEFDTDAQGNKVQDILEFDQGVIKNGLIHDSQTPTLIKEKDRLFLAQALNEQYKLSAAELASQLDLGLDKVEQKLSGAQQKEMQEQQHEAARDGRLAEFVKEASHKRNVEKAELDILPEDQRQAKVQKTVEPPELEQEQMANLAAQREPIKENPEEPEQQKEEPKQEMEPERNPVEAVFEMDPNKDPQIQEEEKAKEARHEAHEAQLKEDEKKIQELRYHKRKEQAEGQGASMGENASEDKAFIDKQEEMINGFEQEVDSPGLGEPTREYPDEVIEKTQGMQRGIEAANKNFVPGINLGKGAKVAQNLQAQAEKIGEEATKLKQPPKAPPKKPDAGPAIAAGGGGRM